MLHGEQDAVVVNAVGFVYTFCSIVVAIAVNSFVEMSFQTFLIWAFGFNGIVLAISILVWRLK